MQKHKKKSSDRVNTTDMRIEECKMRKIYSYNVYSINNKIN